ncbi:hypothetical protein BD289DRAFT_436297 [Coniella lustricola]|uniref:Uncharacterized protein n=1 Tax=Coniella lustricola TaxID=2025994 RepID=A0A2T3A5E4_9PEZI|nr:hypothetical protein BD289DRAFT_436297 [Coniella lustricola]
MYRKGRKFAFCSGVLLHTMRFEALLPGFPLAEKTRLRIFHGTPASCLQSVRCAHNRRVVRSDPFVIHFRGDVENDLAEGIQLEVQFMGQYREPNLGYILLS